MSNVDSLVSFQGANTGGYVNAAPSAVAPPVSLTVTPIRGNSIVQANNALLSFSGSVSRVAGTAVADRWYCRYSGLQFSDGTYHVQMSLSGTFNFTTAADGLGTLGFDYSTNFPNLVNALPSSISLTNFANNAAFDVVTNNWKPISVFKTNPGVIGINTDSNFLVPSNATDGKYRFSVTFTLIE